MDALCTAMPVALRTDRSETSLSRRTAYAAAHKAHETARALRAQARAQQQVLSPTAAEAALQGMLYDVKRECEEVSERLAAMTTA